MRLGRVGNMADDRRVYIIVFERLQGDHRNPWLVTWTTC